MVSTLFSLLSDLFYPHNCPGCGEPVPGPLALCDRCREGVYHPRPFHPDSLGCPHLDGLFFLFDYAGAIQEALHKTKFEKREDLLPRLAREWQAGVAREGRFAWQLPAEVDLGVTAIPTDPVRRKQRGYDVPEEIFRPWALKNGYRWAPLLQRIRPTRPQFSLTPAERKENIRGCFALAPEALMPDIVLLCDDICTTGATLEEAARVLKQGGAQKVYGLALASSN